MDKQYLRNDNIDAITSGVHRMASKLEAVHIQMSSCDAKLFQMLEKHKNARGRQRYYRKIARKSSVYGEVRK